MFTNREEVLENALRVFAKMNYEKASQMEIAKACGLSKAGLVYYYPFKLDLFVAVVDKYIFHTQQLENKFQFMASSFSEFTPESDLVISGGVKFPGNGKGTLVLRAMTACKQSHRRKGSQGKKQEGLFVERSRMFLSE